MRRLALWRGLWYAWYMDKDLQTQTYWIDENETGTHFSMQEITVDGIYSSRRHDNNEGVSRMVSNLMFGTVDEPDHFVYFNRDGSPDPIWESPYYCAFGDPIDEEVWLKHGKIVDVHGKHPYYDYY